MQVMTYDKHGQLCDPHWSNMAQIVIDKKTSYYIKCMNQVSHGIPINPHETSFNPQMIKPNTSYGSDPAKFKLVSEECFETYLTFLHSKNDLYYRQVLSLGNF